MIGICVVIMLQHVKRHPLLQHDLHQQLHTVTNLMNFHHFCPNSNIKDINFFEFLVHVLSITSHHRG